MNGRAAPPRRPSRAQPSGHGRAERKQPSPQFRTPQDENEKQKAPRSLGAWTSMDRPPHQMRRAGLSTILNRNPHRNKLILAPAWPIL